MSSEAASATARGVFNIVIREYLQAAADTEYFADDIDRFVGRLQLYLLSVLQDQSETQVEADLVTLWDLLIETAQAIDPAEPGKNEFSESNGSKKLRALSCLPIYIALPLAGFERLGDEDGDTVQDEESPYNGVKKPQVTSILKVLRKNNPSFYAKARIILTRGPHPTSKSLTPWLSLNSFLAQAFNAHTEDTDSAISTATSVFARALETDLPLTSDGAKLSEALESWISAAAIWMDVVGPTVAAEVFRGKKEQKLYFASAGAKPGPLAIRKGITDSKVSKKRWVFWRDSFRRVKDLASVLEHGPGPEPGGNAVVEMVKGAKEGVKAVQKAEDMYGPGGELADASDKNGCCIIL